MRAAREKAARDAAAAKETAEAAARGRVRPRGHETTDRITPAIQTSIYPVVNQIASSIPQKLKYVACAEVCLAWFVFGTMCGNSSFALSFKRIFKNIVCSYFQTDADNS